MKRLLLGLALVAPIGCKKEASSDPKFDKAWSELTAKGAEPAFIEGDLHGAGLMGEIRRATERVPGDTQLVENTVLPGPLPDDQVVRVIRQNLGMVKGCYKLAEREGTLASGKAIVSMEIDPAGSVSSVSVDAPAFSESKLPACVRGRAQLWQFPKFTQGPKRFSYPFVFVGG